MEGFHHYAGQSPVQFPYSMMPVQRKDTVATPSDSKWVSSSEQHAQHMMCECECLTSHYNTYSTCLSATTVGQMYSAFSPHFVSHLFPQVGFILTLLGPKWGKKDVCQNKQNGKKNKENQTTKVLGLYYSQPITMQHNSHAEELMGEFSCYVARVSWNNSLNSAVQCALTKILLHCTL